MDRALEAFGNPALSIPGLVALFPHFLNLERIAVRECDANRLRRS
jgi:hypothetical protein